MTNLSTTPPAVPPRRCGYYDANAQCPLAATVVLTIRYRAHSDPLQFAACEKCAAHRMARKLPSESITSEPLAPESAT